MTFPRIAAYAEQAWGRKAGSYAEFQQKMPAQVKRYEVMGVNYRIPNISHEERIKKQPEGYKK